MLDLTLHPQQETQKIIDFIRSSLSKTPFNKLIIALSGGIDSSTASIIAIKAINVHNVHIALFPYRNLNSDGISKALQLTSILNVPKQNITSIDITSMVDQITSLDNGIDNIRRGNIMARVRMILLYDLAKKHKALVLGTENKTEHLLGYFTRFGDEASDIEPIRHLYKTQVKKLAQFLEIPTEIINAPPTAGLWEDQTDEGEFGFSYEEADQILHLAFDKNYPKEKIINAGFTASIVEKVLKRVEDNKFKHELPHTL